MWCTRWFLPLLIIPLPTASPFFLTFFLVSVTLHARPCFYCMILMTALFSSTCYWQPISTNTLLTNPIGDARTFGDAISANLTMYDEENRIKYAPAMIQLIDRCWCDFGLWSTSVEGDGKRGDIFSPRDVSRWENASIQVARKDYARKLKESKKESTVGDESASIGEKGAGEVDESKTVDNTRSSTDSPFLWRLWDDIFQSTPSSLNHSSQEQAPSESQNDTIIPDIPSNESWFRREYDLRKHGLDIVIDFSWSRES
ncbi:hypothetical protein SCHPADRAFT_944675 [Schizopora paradoxa]|uniref:Uncharacterized protein n=1 Tax=Schizopora paradoxa TaxID=27342 RepID=A0A0H2RTM6_9AGAM|nr:hypothetical protein SCHPADRAFT_944675 [Schizopora paradoxa]